MVVKIALEWYNVAKRDNNIRIRGQMSIANNSGHTSAKKTNDRNNTTALSIQINHMVRILESRTTLVQE